MLWGLISTQHFQVSRLSHHQPFVKLLSLQDLYTAQASKDLCKAMLNIVGYRAQHYNTTHSHFVSDQCKPCLGAKTVRNRCFHPSPTCFLSILFILLLWAGKWRWNMWIENLFANFGRVRSVYISLSLNKFRFALRHVLTLDGNHAGAKEEKIAPALWMYT